MMKLLFTFLLLMAFMTGRAQTETESIQCNDFKIMMDSIPGVVVLDLRTSEELKSGIIPGARHIDYFEKHFDSEINKLDRTPVYLLYCASGGRSTETLLLMQAKGFQQVYHLEGGFARWKKDKMPVETPKRH
jgi:rhodanese-related sulfurtransferase